MRRLLSSPAAKVLVAFETVIYLSFHILDMVGQEKLAIALKFAGITVCFAFAVISALNGGDRLVAAALALTTAADVFLLVMNRYYLAGVGLFLCVQLCYLARLRGHTGPLGWALRGLLPAVLLIGLGCLHMLTPLNALAAVCFSQLVLNALLAWGVPGGGVFAAGLTLFVGCDTCVGVYNLLSSAPAPVRYGMWAFYLPAQVLIVLSGFPKKARP